VPASAVLGWGRHVPERLVTNGDLATALGTSAAAIAAASGVERRHYAAPGLGPSDLGKIAAEQALAAAGLGADDVDLIVFATMTPDIPFPGSGCFLQHKLGCRTVGALDIRSQCAGFLFGLAVADRFVRAEAAARVLVVGGEVHSSALDQSPRGALVTPCFGDGAGAAVVGAADAPGILATALHSDPTGLERFWCEFPASRHFPARMDLEQLQAGRHFYVVDQKAIEGQAERSLVAVADEVLTRAGVKADDVALFVVHYLDPRVARRAGATAKMPADRVVATAESAGHVAAAGIPVAVADALATGRVRRGDLVCCVAFGAGLSWAGAVLRL
jgi:3-oxoacyl-[acyl-carrier-protein] synthase-3